MSWIEADSAEGLIQTVTDLSCILEYPVRIKVEQVGDTLSYKAVFWIWMRAMAESFTQRGGKPFTADDMHDLMCHQFLGYTAPRTLGKTKIEPALRTITYPKDLTKGEFYDLLRRIEEWCVNVGVQLPENPSEYSEAKRKEVA